MRQLRVPPIASTIEASLGSLGPAREQTSCSWRAIHSSTSQRPPTLSASSFVGNGSRRTASDECWFGEAGGQQAS